MAVAVRERTLRRKLVDSKGRTIRFRPLGDGSRWQVLVYEQGKSNPQRFYFINMYEDAQGKWHICCNCPKKFYRCKGDEQCHHEEAFEKYMEDLIQQGKTKPC